MTSANWLIETLRLTAFGPVGEQADIEQVWHACGIPLDLVNDDRKNGQFVLQGDWKDLGLMSLTAKKKESVMQFQLNPNRNDENRFIGDWSSVAPGYVDTCKKVLTELKTDVTRLAFGAVLHHMVDDRRTGYKYLADFLPSVTYDPTASDLVFQINRPRKSAVLPSEINRLSSWAVVEWKVVKLIDGEMSETPESSITARLSLDINTSQKYEGNLPKGDLPKVFDELFEFGSEIASKGDF